MPRWLEQSFLGVRCTYGEDRALTNDILAQGFDSVFQRQAIVRSIVPVSYARLAKKYLRWDRSYVREEIRFARIVWRRPPVARAIALVDSTLMNLRYPVAWTTLFLLVTLSVEDPTTILRVAAAIGILALFNLLFYLHTERSLDFVWGLAYAFFSAFTLFWIMPFAMVTVRARSWMTR